MRCEQLSWCFKNLDGQALEVIDNSTYLSY